MSFLDGILQNPTPMGLLAIALAILWVFSRGAWRLLDSWLARKFDARGWPMSPQGVPLMSPMACQIDPKHFERIREMDARTLRTAELTEHISEALDAHREHYHENVATAVASGAFSCAMRGRDEVNSLFELLRNIAEKLDRVADELEKTRNGK